MSGSSNSSASGLEGASVSSSHSRRNGAKERFWREAISGRAASGASIRDYCRKRGLSEAGFYAWRRELALRDAEASQGEATQLASHPAFAKVRVVAAASERPAEPLAAPSSAMEIVFPNRLRLRLRGPVDAESLSQVVRVLREAPSC